MHDCKQPVFLGRVFTPVKGKLKSKHGRRIGGRLQFKTRLKDIHFHRILFAALFVRDHTALTFIADSPISEPFMFTRWDMSPVCTQRSGVGRLSLPPPELHKWRHCAGKVGNGFQLIYFTLSIHVLFDGHTVYLSMSRLCCSNQTVQKCPFYVTENIILCSVCTCNIAIRVR